jgi:hypothetical protein
MDYASWFNEDIRELVLWSLETMPDNLKLSIGGAAYSKKELKDHVTKGDSIGLIFAKIQMDYLKAVADGRFTKFLTQ